MKTFVLKSLNILVTAAFVVGSFNIPQSQANGTVIDPMPTPGSMVFLSPAFTPTHLQGMTIHPDNPLEFDFLVNKGGQNLDETSKKAEYQKLIKYFMAALTVPDEHQWVNLSPYEKNRIINNDFGLTEMGRELLAQDYLLKQLTSSLMYPESGLGKKFWGKVYERAYKEYGTTNIPVNTFNKVWIVPDQAIVYESGNSVYILKSHLKVMLEEDYLSLNKHTAITNAPTPLQNNKTHTVASKVIREVILPAIEREVNEGQNFAQLRQVVSGMILATWYKKALKESLLGKVYADKAKLKGVDQDPQNNEIIYQRYLAAFKKGVYNYIKEDEDLYSKQPVARKYFAGGFWNPLGEGAEEVLNRNNIATLKDGDLDLAQLSREGNNLIDVRIVMAPTDSAMSIKSMVKWGAIGAGVIGAGVTGAASMNSYVSGKLGDITSGIVSGLSHLIPSNPQEEKVREVEIDKVIRKNLPLCSGIYGPTATNFDLIVPYLDQVKLRKVLNNLGLPSMEELAKKNKDSLSVIDRMISDPVAILSLPGIQEKVGNSVELLDNSPGDFNLLMGTPDTGIPALAKEIKKLSSARNWFKSLVQNVFLEGTGPLDGVDTPENRFQTWNLLANPDLVNLTKINQAIESKTGIKDALRIVKVDTGHYEIRYYYTNPSTGEVTFSRIAHWRMLIGQDILESQTLNPKLEERQLKQGEDYEIYFNGLTKAAVIHDSPLFDWMKVIGTDEGFKIILLGLKDSNDFIVRIEPDDTFNDVFNPVNVYSLGEALKAIPRLPEDYIRKATQYADLTNIYAWVVDPNRQYYIEALLRNAKTNQLQQSPKPQIFNVPYKIEDLQTSPNDILVILRQLDDLNEAAKFLPDADSRLIKNLISQRKPNLLADNKISSPSRILAILNTAPTLYLVEILKKNPDTNKISNEIRETIKDINRRYKIDFVNEPRSSQIELANSSEGIELNQRTMADLHMGTWSKFSGRLEPIFTFKIHWIKPTIGGVEPPGSGEDISPDQIRPDMRKNLDDQLMRFQFGTPQAYRAMMRLSANPSLTQYAAIGGATFRNLKGGYRAAPNNNVPSDKQHKANPLQQALTPRNGKSDSAQAVNPGGIDLNANNMDFIDLKRDGKGVPLPFSQQDISALRRITGFVPQIREITPVTGPLPILSEFKAMLKNRMALAGNI